MVSEQEITVFRGESVTLAFEMASSEDISGWGVEFTVAGSPKVTKVIGPKEGAVTDGPGGEFQVLLTAEETDLPPGRYLYDVFRVDAGAERALAVGVFRVRDVARLPV